MPRWAGDANFLPVIGQTKALPQLLDQTWQVVTDAWDRLERSRTLDGPGACRPGGGNADVPRGRAGEA